MDYIVIEGVKPYDGRYEFDVPGFDPTWREWGWIKRLSGYMPLTLEEGLAGGDPELILVLAIIAMRRAGKIGNDDVSQVYERFQDTAFGAAIRLEVGAEDDAEDPTTASLERSFSVSASTSGDESTTSSEKSDRSLPPTGTHGWASSGSG